MSSNTNADNKLLGLSSNLVQYQERNEHNYLGDFDAEQDLYAKSGKLIEYLSQWDCEKCDTVPKRMEHPALD